MSAARRGTPRGAAAGAAGLAPGGPNLARLPFVNQRPVRRVAVLLLAAAVVVLLVDLWLYVGYARSRSATASELDSIEARITTERQALNDAQRTLDSASVDEQNALVEFLNRRIAERTFGWSVLFDRLAVLLPDDVRLVSLAPSFFAPDEAPARPGAARTAAAPGAEPSREVRLALQGRARRDDAILELVDALFADPAFTDPDLSREARQGGEVAFSLSVTYLPRVAEGASAGGGEAPPPAGETGDGDTAAGEAAAGDTAAGQTAAGDAARGAAAGTAAGGAA